MSQDNNMFMSTTNLTAKPGELEYMQLCNVRNSEGPYKTKLMVQHPCIALVSGAAICG